ncbi:MAG TPA: hypothetical protein DEA28_02975 [Firmicutes bacterium]|nr:hypothetical protein [Bacillota bacterium]
MKKKIKLRDLTKEQYLKWRMVYRGSNNCSGTCEKCPLRLVHCHPENKECWIYHKEIFSDKFLDQEIEIEAPDILDKEEKEYLSAVIKPFRNKIISICKYTIKFENKENTIYYYIRIKTKSKTEIFHNEFISLPYFKNEMYKCMENHKEYTLEELGL